MAAAGDQTARGRKLATSFLFLGGLRGVVGVSTITVVQLSVTVGLKCSGGMSEW